jgi:hypothetical protein
MQKKSSKIPDKIKPINPVITKDDVQTTNEYLDSLNGVSSIMSNLSGIFNQNSDSVLSWAANSLGAIASLIVATQALTLAKKQEAVASAVASAAETPVVGWLLVAGAAVAALAALTSIPQMANGGLVYGNSLVNVGEYAGASNNPEVIAPLSKLKGLLSNDTSLSGGEVRFKIDGTNLVGVLNNYNRKTNKIR